jgi:nucleoside-diphosphate-sugar epimerase
MLKKFSELTVEISVLKSMNAISETGKKNRETVIVTGASGFIGYALCEQLGKTHNVIGFDRPGVPHPPPTTMRMDIDLSSEDSFKQVFQTIQERYGTKITSVIHLAAYYDFAGQPSSKYEEITVQGTAHLLHFLKSFEVDQFIFSSTMLVHAPCQPGQRITEEWPLDPKWDYPKSKVKTENLIRRERGDMPVVLLRVAGVYDEQCHSIPIAHQIQRIYERSLTSHLFPGDTSHGQSFIHLNDTVDLITTLVKHRSRLPPELPLLAGEPQALSYEALQHEIARLIHGKPWTTTRIPKIVATCGAWLQDHIPFLPASFIKPWMIDLADDHYEVDISKAKNWVGWETKHSLFNTLPAMIQSLKENPLGWYKENNLTPPGWLKRTHAMDFVGKSLS